MITYKDDMHGQNDYDIEQSIANQQKEQSKLSTPRELSWSLRPHVLLYGLDEPGHLLLLGPGARAHPALRAVAGLVLQARDAVGEVRARVVQDHEALLRAEAEAAHGADTCSRHVSGV